MASETNRLYSLLIVASLDNKYEFVIDIVSGTLKFEGIVSWLTSNTRTMNDR